MTDSIPGSQAQVFFAPQREGESTNTLGRHVERSVTVLVEESSANAVDVLIQAQAEGYCLDKKMVKISFVKRNALVSELNKNLNINSFGERYDEVREKHLNLEQYHEEEEPWADIVKDGVMEILCVEDDVCGAFGEQTHRKIYTTCPGDKAYPFGLFGGFGTSAKTSGQFAGTQGYGGRVACLRASRAHLVGIFSDPIDGQDAIFAGHSILGFHKYKGQEYDGTGFVKMLDENGQSLTGRHGLLRDENAKQIMRNCGVTNEMLMSKQIRLSMMIMAPHAEFLDNRIVGCEVLVSQFVRILNGLLMVVLPDGTEITQDNFFDVLARARDEEWFNAYADYGLKPYMANIKMQIHNLPRVAGLYTEFCKTPTPSVVVEHPAKIDATALTNLRDRFQMGEMLVIQTDMKLKKIPRQRNLEGNDNLAGKVTSLLQKTAEDCDIQVYVRGSRVLWQNGKVGIPSISMTLVDGDNVSALLRDSENVQHDRHDGKSAHEKGWNLESSLATVQVFRRGGLELIRRLNEAPRTNSETWDINSCWWLQISTVAGNNGKVMKKKKSVANGEDVHSGQSLDNKFFEFESLPTNKAKMGYQKLKIVMSGYNIPPSTTAKFSFCYMKEGNDGRATYSKEEVDMEGNVDLETMSRGFTDVSEYDKSIVFSGIDNTFEVVLEFMSIPGMAIEPVVEFIHVDELANVA